jgi:polyphosphate kinase
MSESGPLRGALRDPGEALRSLGPQRFLNRELSWLDFNARVLALVESPDLPLLERVKFAAIFSSNLDEFFQVRVGGLRAQIRAGYEALSADGLTPQAQCELIHQRVGELVHRQQQLVHKTLLPALAAAGVRLTTWQELGPDDRAYLRKVFERQIFPILTPLSVDPVHPFPAISSLSLNLAVLLEDPDTHQQGFARVKVPPVLPRFHFLPDERRFVATEALIGAFLGELFPGMTIVAHYPFRVTRDADIELDEGEAEDLMAALESELRERLRLKEAARLEVDAAMSPAVRELLMRELDLGPRDVYAADGLIDLTCLWEIYALPRPELKDETWVPVTPPVLRQPEEAEIPIFGVLNQGDLLVHHPYESFRASVEAFIRQAAEDPQVLAIKHTLYRTSGTTNPVVQALCLAAQRGKEVVALVELKARFDEQANIERARLLEEAGCHVVYGIVGLKTHAKIAMVVRRESDGIRRYCHIGTGNYNPDTARQYEDLGLFTSSPEIGSDVAHLFNYLTGSSRAPEYRRLWVAPHTLRRHLVEQIEAEALHPDGQIAIKMNSLADPPMIDALYAASQAGVRIDLIVRGICCLRPGVPGLSENIRVRSILGRFLEHSRIYRFGSEARGYRYWIGSADLMTRNLNGRVEALVPVEDPALEARLEEVLRVAFEDDVAAWELDGSGSWARVPAARGLSSQRRLQALALARH